MLDLLKVAGLRKLVMQQQLWLVSAFQDLLDTSKMLEAAGANQCRRWGWHL